MIHLAGTQDERSGNVGKRELIGWFIVIIRFRQTRDNRCERERNSRASGEDQHHGKVDRVEENHHRFVPSKYDEHDIDPVWDLCDAHDRAPFRLDVVCIGLASEPRTKLERLCLGEHD